MHARQTIFTAQQRWLAKTGPHMAMINTRSGSGMHAVRRVARVGAPDPSDSHFGPPHPLRLGGDLIDDKSVWWPHQKSLVLAFQVFESMQSVYARHGLGQCMQIARPIE